MSFHYGPVSCSARAMRTCWMPGWLLLLVQVLVLLQTRILVDAGPKREQNNVSHFVYNDCGTDITRPLRVLNFTVNPVPLRTPGKVKLSAAINVTETLPRNIGVDVLVSKYFLGIPFKLPCYKNVGTCHYEDVCTLLESQFAKDCSRLLRKHGIPCRCDVRPDVYHLNRLSFYVPEFGGILEALATGEYDAKIRIFDAVDNRELGCLQIQFDMKRQRQKRHGSSAAAQQTMQNGGRLSKN